MTYAVIKMTFHPRDDLTIVNKDLMMASCVRGADAWVWDGLTLHVRTNDVIQALNAFEEDGYNLEEFAKIEITPVKSR